MMSVEPLEISSSPDVGRFVSIEITEDRTTENQNAQFPPPPEFRYTPAKLPQPLKIRIFTSGDGSNAGRSTYLKSGRSNGKGTR